MNPETILQNEIRCALSDHGICIRLNTGLFFTPDGRLVKCGINGMPDLIFLGSGGRVIWLEVKIKKKKPSDDQERFMAKLTEMGHTVGVVRSVDEALKLVGVT